MKISKCPFCKSTPVIRYSREKIFGDFLYITGCSKCNFFTGDKCRNADLSIKSWNRLVSRFPKITQLIPGDVIEFDDVDGSQKGKIAKILRDSDGDFSLVVRLYDDSGLCEIQDKVYSFQINHYPKKIKYKK